ncbi:MAG: ATP-dependent DNA helicase PcrA, partial [Desulfotomaculaceae bacterium]|nr:ATP-dependent DNA helicase PcrA [Desulfotomaculaceae bacterium]
EKYNKPSRFLEEIPPHLLSVDDFLGKTSRKHRPGMAKVAGAKKFLASKRFILGDRVRHSKWGPGVIVGVQGEEEDTEYQVAFPEQGIKLLLAKFAPLEKADEELDV